MDVLFRGVINVCNSDVFNVVNIYLDHLKFYVVCIYGRRYVCCSECYVFPTEFGDPASYLVVFCIFRYAVVKLCTLDVFALGISLVSWIKMICMCVVNNHF